MKKNEKRSNNNNKNKNPSNNGIIPYSFRFISSCLKTASSGVRSASGSVAASISSDSQTNKDQVLWACFDRLEFSPSFFKHVLLLGYNNGFQVLDVQDACNVIELVSKRDDPVTFLQMQPLPAKSDSSEGFRPSHPLLLVVASDESKSFNLMQDGNGLARDDYNETQPGNILSPTIVRFYSLKSHNYVHVLRFRSTVYMVRCSPQIVAVGLASQIYCFDAVTLENKFSVLTYPVPQLGAQGMVGVNIGYGPMAVGPRWLAYSPNNAMLSNTGRLSPKCITPSEGSPSTSPQGGSLVARYAMESSKQLAVGLLNLGDMGYKTFSKYYQELIPDGSSPPASSNSGWKVGRGNVQESDVAGMVVLKDFVSRAVVSQFRAHTSPISALCFDPSGTLLVTASINGNNINIFRIMPSCTNNGSGNQSHDWSSSHVHLYKLHRGMTSAVIQDIRFSQYSQWIAVVSSKGTCHIFVLCPFGGETVLEVHNSQADGPTLLPALSFPWWSSPYFRMNQHSSPSPHAVTLSVVSRIKNNHSGWLNTVSNVASSAAGKVPTPSGAVTAVFHSSVPHDLHPVQLKFNALEHLMVYTPSGHVVQYKLLPSMGGEPSENVSRTGPGSSSHIQDEDLRVKVELMQWWDVCRRIDWTEREESIYEDTLDFEDSDIVDKEMVKTHEHPHLYISNAEVSISSERIPIWQNSKMYFYAMSFPGANDQIFASHSSGGEVEIEKFSVHDFEIKRKDLLPIFNNFHSMFSKWGDRGLSDTTSQLNSEEVKQKFSQNSAISHVKMLSAGSVQNSNGGLLLRDSGASTLQFGNDVNGEKRAISVPPLKHISTNEDICSNSSTQSNLNVSPLGDGDFLSGQSTLSRSIISAERTIVKGVQSLNGPNAGSNVSSGRSDLSMNIDGGPVHDSLDYECFFQEGYCKASGLSNDHEPREIVTDVDSSSSPCYGEKSEDGDNNDMLGGVFAFSEEG